MVRSSLVCSECGAVMVIPRPSSLKRERGHIKHMYCYKCKEKTAFIEGVKKDKNVSFWESWHKQNEESDTNA